MGRATRWLKNLFGIKRDKEQQHKENSNSRILCHNPATIPPNLSTAEAAWLQSFYKETDNEQNKHALAVAEATATAANAAVAAAQAAVVMVRLTSHDRSTMFSGGHQMCAAIKVQTLFRGFLARKALRALKGLVKLQALVRGYLVRKQATATLHSMQALIRAQATVRSHKSRGLISTKNEAYRFQNRARRSMEIFDDYRSEYTAPIHSRRLSSSFDTPINYFNNTNSVDESPKIVEVDTGNSRPNSRSRRTNTSISDFGDDPSFQTLSSPLPIPYARLSIPDHRNFNDSSECELTGEECRFSSTAHNTPRFTNSCSCGATVTPNAVGTDYLFLREYGNYPNYMGNTQSFKAKLRSHSAPKQRPEHGQIRKRISLNEMMESGNSLSGFRMHRSGSQVQEAVNFKNAVMGKLYKSTESAKEMERNYFHSRRC
ncbi:hypothetical protein Lal_00010095 [Lupinus albus]|uniref:Putative IQ motif, EF-hand binding protein n=1 Tax=Lupinus albus TaxID=3870 RepID=A0A6A5LDH5_LUPAL|nr:putative IQ motif, EF-hand binding protein [Lupinus albus]KAF1859511.1 hypothetical protein Lal_00010095 [Lupinus albus]